MVFRDGTERRERIEQTLFGKYELCRVISHGQNSTVYLAKHRELDEYRAIKQVSKSSRDFERFRREGLILKQLRHPGIPIVYDLEEDAQYGYLIEEFLEGKSIYALVSDMGRFSPAMAVRYGIQLCHLVTFLHSASPTPILYLDFQPRNLLVCADTVKLIDFDHAADLQEANDSLLRYGTAGCAAPEQYTGEPLDERTDIYAVGALLHYMLTGSFPGEPSADAEASYAGRRLMRVIAPCLRTDRARRYQSAEELQRALENLVEGIFKLPETGLVPPLAIAAAAGSSGAGATHLTIGLCAWLRTQGISAVYEERNGSGAVRALAEYRKEKPDRYGMYQIWTVPMLPQYGACVNLKKAPCQVRILDYGTDLEKLKGEQADACMLVCGAKPWETPSARKAVEVLGTVPGLAVIYNHVSMKRCGNLPAPKQMTDCFLAPCFADPFVPDRGAGKAYGAVWQAWFGKGAAEKRGRLCLEKKKDLPARKAAGSRGERWEWSEQDARRASLISLSEQRIFWRE